MSSKERVRLQNTRALLREKFPRRKVGPPRVEMYSTNGKEKELVVTTRESVHDQKIRKQDENISTEVFPDGYAAREAFQRRARWARRFGRTTATIELAAPVTGFFLMTEGGAWGVVGGLAAFALSIAVDKPRRDAPKRRRLNEAKVRAVYEQTKVIVRPPAPKA